MAKQGRHTDRMKLGSLPYKKAPRTQLVFLVKMQDGNSLNYQYRGDNLLAFIRRLPGQLFVVNVYCIGKQRLSFTPDEIFQLRRF